MNITFLIAGLLAAMVLLLGWELSGRWDFLSSHTLYGAKILSIAKNRSGRLTVIIVDDTSQDISSTNRSCCVTYCPDNPVTRAQMAVFLVRTFSLP
jgi:hypothetical protein